MRYCYKTKKKAPNTIVLTRKLEVAEESIFTTMFGNNFGDGVYISLTFVMSRKGKGRVCFRQLV